MAEAVNRARAYSLLCELRAEYARYQSAVGFIPISELKLQEDLRRYLCLRCAGFLEQLAYVSITYYLNVHTHGASGGFARSFFPRAPNLNVNALEKLIVRFGDDFSTSLAEWLNPTRRESLGDLLDVRNDVAHGKHQSGRKLDPSRYIAICEDMYEWMCTTFFADSVDVIDDDGLTVLDHVRSSATEGDRT